MTAPRLILALASLAFIGFGVVFLVSPESMARLMDIALETPTARTEVRGMYGGLEIGLGAFLLTTVVRGDHVALGLRVALFAFAGLAAGRIYGLFADAFWQPVMFLLIAVEAAAAALTWWAIRAVHTARRSAVEVPGQRA